jgi:polyribonucleotide nucleotidyltransferase
MFDIVRKEIEWGGETLSMETGKMARQADGSVIVTYGETTVMAMIRVHILTQQRDFTHATIHEVSRLGQHLR